MAELATNNSDSFSTKHPKLTKTGKFIGKDIILPSLISEGLDYFIPEGSPYRKYVDGVNELYGLYTPVWGLGVDSLYAAKEGNYKQAATNAGLAGLSATNPIAGGAIYLLKKAYDRVQSGEVDHAANRQYLSEYNTALTHLLQDAEALQRRGYSDEDINKYLTIRIQQRYRNSPISNDLMRALNGEENFTSDSLTYPVPNSAYRELRKQQAQQQQQPTTPTTNEDTNTGGIISTANAAEIPPNATPAVPTPVQQPQALSQLVNGGNIWTSGDASKAKSGVTWSMAVPNSEQYQRLKASADFANSLNSYKNRTDLSNVQKEQMAIADLIALGLK